MQVNHRPFITPAYSNTVLKALCLKYNKIPFLKKDSIFQLYQFIKETVSKINYLIIMNHLLCLDSWYYIISWRKNLK
jgi:hypothetical protein